jgi:3-hydroxyisobutyrate dehydrogenase
MSRGAALPGMGIGWIGVGAMGGAMLRCALDAGYTAAICDVRDEATRPFAGHPRVRVAASPRQAAQSAGLVSVVVLDDAQVREVVLGRDGVLAGAAPGQIVLIHSTVEPQTVIEVGAAAAQRGVHVLDAAVSGARGQDSAGQLCVMVGGPREPFEAALPLLRTFGSTIEHLGLLGAGMAAKLVRNLIVYLSYLAHYEGVQLAEQVGIDRKTLERILEATGLRSETVAAFHLSRPTMRPHEPSTEPQAHAAALATAATGRKDLGAAIAFARSRGLDLPTACHALGRLEAVFGVRGDP